VPAFRLVSGDTSRQFRWIPGLGRWGQNAAAEAKQAGGEELGDLVPALDRETFGRGPWHDVLPAAHSHGLLRETYAVGDGSVRNQERARKCLYHPQVSHEQILSP
jgi:hypothetical protein